LILSQAGDAGIDNELLARED